MREHRGVTRLTRRWPKGTWMRLKSAELLRAFVGHGAEKKMSGRRLARYVGCHPSFIDHLLAGRKNTCLPKTAALIAEALEVPLHILFDPQSSSSERASLKQAVA